MVVLQQLQEAIEKEAREIFYPGQEQTDRCKRNNRQVGLSNRAGLPDHSAEMSEIQPKYFKALC